MWTEGSPRLGLDERHPDVAGLPNLSPQSIEALLRASGVCVSSVPMLLEQLHAAGLQDNLGLAIAAAWVRQERTYGVLPAVLDACVEQRLSRVRQRGSVVNAFAKARELLRNLAALRRAITPFIRAPAVPTRDELRKAFRGMLTRVQTEDEGWTLLDLIVRGGLMEQRDFAYPALAYFFSAEQSVSESCVF